MVPLTVGGAAKSKIVTLVFWVLSPIIPGLPLFYTGNIALGLVFLFTCNCFGIGNFVLLILLLTNQYKDGNGNLLKNDCPTWAIIVGFVGMIMVATLLGGVIFNISENNSSNSESSYYSEEPQVQEPQVQEPQVYEPEVQEQEPVYYISIDVGTLISDLDSNALRAERTWQDAYVAVSGYISSFDSDGGYFSLKASTDPFEFNFTNIQCFIEDDTTLNKLLSYNEDDPITVYGQITSIGEIIGYLIDVDYID